MKVRWEQMFPGQTFEAFLSSTPSQISRDEEQVVLEIAAPAPLLLEPGNLRGVEIVEATPEEIAALKAAGFDFPGAPGGAPAKKRPWWRNF
jgi:hypothetical protein